MKQISCGGVFAQVNIKKTKGDAKEDNRAERAWLFLYIIHKIAITKYPAIKCMPFFSIPER